MSSITTIEGFKQRYCGEIKTFFISIRDVNGNAVFESNDASFEWDGTNMAGDKVASGTYIRSLARDLAERLGTLGYVRELRRTSIHDYKVEDAYKLDEITPENWQELLISIDDSPSR